MAADALQSGHFGGKASASNKPPRQAPAFVNNRFLRQMQSEDGTLDVCKRQQLMQTVCLSRRPKMAHPLAAGCVRNPLTPTTTSSIIMSVERRGSMDRRSGKDRRQEEKGPPTNFERRRAIEARQPELTELHMSEDELKALGFDPNPSGNARKAG